MTAPLHPQHSSRQRAFTLESLPTFSSRGALQRVKRFDGLHRTSRGWDGLRKDEELWNSSGTCYVHLYNAGTSRRGCSFKIPFAALDRTHNLEACLHRPMTAPGPTLADSSASSDEGSDSGYGSASHELRDGRPCDIFIPSPAGCSRNEAYLYHLTTRNYFAYLLHKPLVGQNLGKALSDLASRIELWHGSEGVSSTDFLDYCQEQGYLNFGENPDYAAASLYLAERARIKDIWSDAFAHCVGMKDHLDNCPEVQPLSKMTRTLIDRAAQEMESHIASVTKALGEFLEEDLGPEYLGLSKPLRDHLDRFRSTLHTFYVHEVGYFPPDPNLLWEKRLWCGMYDDFQSLYSYLADTRSSTDIASIRGLNGGICAVQNVQAFDERHGFDSLPHPMPLLPDPAMVGDSIDMQRGFRNLRRRTLVSSNLDMAAKQALTQASNSRNPEITGNRLVREYMRFERLKLEERVSVIEARKVRWILICGVLQMLISITRAPAGVQDIESPSYPLCIPTIPNPPWTMAANTNTMPERGQLDVELSAEMDAVRRTLEEDRISIHPDCEADCADEYFARDRLTRSASDDMSLNMMSSPLRRSGTQLSRTASIRSSVRSAVGSLSRRNSVRRSSLVYLPKKRPSFCEIMVEGYGNGLECDEAGQGPINEEASPDEETLHAPEELDDDWQQADNVPTLELHQLNTGCNHIVKEEEELDSPSTTRFSDFSGRWSESSKSSYADECDSPCIEQKARSEFDMDFSAFKFDFGPTREDDIPEEEPGDEPPPTYQARRWKTSGNDKPTSVNAGCYMPSGASGPKIQRHAVQSRDLSSESVESIGSSTSSMYSDTNMQAAEIEEEEPRGRRRQRGSDRTPRFGVARGEISPQETPEEGIA